jgi:rod shape determining protein RodA
MNKYNFLRESYQTKPVGKLVRPIWTKMHIDLPLFASLILLIVMGLFVLYSADNQDFNLIVQQMIRFALGLGIMFIFAQIPPRYYRTFAPWLYLIGIVLLIGVEFIGHTGKGAQRWLNLGVFRFQPSEIMKLAIPLTLAWYIDKKPLPPRILEVFISLIIVLIPVALVLKQPDLGTAIIITVAGLSVLLLAGMRWQLIVGFLILGLISAPIIWRFMHGYQRQRVITFLNPESDPLASGYHIIQSKIAIGSGGFFGKGWLQGTQSHLQFLPEHATDFIFSVAGEEFGFFGVLILLSAFIVIFLRCLYISLEAQDTFTRLLAGSLSLTFFFSFFVNIGMVTGLLPVVGLPLPLVSYGGTSMVTLLAGFGIIMSIHTHRKLLGT